MTRIVMVDPSQQVPNYDRALAGALAAAGCRVELACAPAVHFDPGPLPLGVRADLVFGRMLTVVGATWPAATTNPPTRRLLRMTSYPAELVAFASRLAADPPAALHVQWGLLPAIEAALWRRLRQAGVPVVYTAHNVLPHESRRGQAAIWRRLYRSVDQLIVHSQAARDRLLQLTGDRAPPVTVVPMAADPGVARPDQAQARYRLGLPVAAPIALFFGHVRPYKGLALLLDALPTVRKSLPDTRLLIAGPVAGGARGLRQLRADVAALGLGQMVDLRAGYVPPQQVDDVFAASDVVVLPYRDTDDSAVLQAARARGRAIIATAIGGLPEVLATGGGVCVPAGDGPALADALIRLLVDPDQRTELEDAALAAAAAWTWSDVAQATLTVYRAAGAHIPRNLARPLTTSP